MTKILNNGTTIPFRSQRTENQSESRLPICENTNITAVEKKSISSNRGLNSVQGEEMEKTTKSFFIHWAIATFLCYRIRGNNFFRISTGAWKWRSHESLIVCAECEMQSSLHIVEVHSNNGTEVHNIIMCPTWRSQEEFCVELIIYIARNLLERKSPNEMFTARIA